MPSRLSKKERLERYQRQLDLSAKWRKAEGYDDTWERMINLYRMKVFPKELTKEERIAIAVAFASINVIYPAISVNYPKITVQGRTPEDDDGAVIVEAVVNYWWRHYGYKKHFRLAAKDFLIIGHGWLKVGYRYKEKELGLAEDEIRESYDEARTQLDAYAMANPEMAADLPGDDDLLGSLPTTKTVPIEDRPFVERVSPFNIYVDPEATSMDDIKWIAQKVTRGVEDVKNDERYRKSVRSNIKADSSPAQFTDPFEKDRQGRQGVTADMERVTVWEFYDVQYDEMCVFVHGGKDYLIEPRSMPYEFGHPFVMLRNYDVPDHFYPLGDLEALEPLQAELNRTRSDMMNHRKRYAPKYVYKKGAFDAEGRAALESQKGGTMVPVVDENQPLNDVVMPFPTVPMDANLYSYSEIIESDIDRVSGISEYQRGGLPEIRRTATEASIVQDASNARSADKLALVEEIIREVAERLVQLAQQFLTGEQVARIVGSNGQPVWVPFEPSDIEGEFDFEVEAGSTQPQNETFRRQQAVQMLNTLAPFMDSGIINPVEMARYALQFGFGIKNPERFLAQGVPTPSTAPPGEQPPGSIDPNTGLPQEAPGPAMPPGVPPELLAQLQGQVGLSLDNMAQQPGII